MKPSFLGLVAAVALACVAGPVSAGTPHWLGYNVSAAIPSGSFADEYKTGFDVGGSYLHQFTSVIGGGVDFAYNSWGAQNSVNDEVAALYGPGTHVTWSTFHLTGDAALSWPTTGRLQPYVKGGVGLYRPSVKLSQGLANANYHDHYFGFNGGGGVNYRWSEDVSIGLNAVYHEHQMDPGMDSIHFISAGFQLMWNVPEFGKY